MINSSFGFAERLLHKLRYRMIFKSTHQTSDNLNKQQPHFLKHARFVDRDAIWNLDNSTLKNFPSSLSAFVASRLTLNYDHTAAVTEVNCHIEPCCGDMHAQRKIHNEQRCAPKVLPNRGHSRTSTSHSSGDGGPGSVLVVRSCCSRTKRESFERTLDFLLENVQKL